MVLSSPLSAGAISESNRESHSSVRDWNEEPLEVQKQIPAAKKKVTLRALQKKTFEEYMKEESEANNSSDQGSGDKSN
jgi:hypothetical protein